MSGYFSYFDTKDYSLTEDVSKKLVDLSQYSTIFSRIADDISFYSYYTMQDGERLDTISQKLYQTPEYYWTIPLVNNRIINVFSNLPKDYPTLIGWLEKKHPGYAFMLADDETLAGKFMMGEIISTATVNKARIIGKYPTRGYIQVEITQGSFPLNDEFTVVGQTSQDVIQIANVIHAYDAPAYHLDSNDNRVKWNDGQVIPITIREVEVQHNIESSQIKVIRPRYIYEVSQQFLAEMNRRRLV